MRILWLGRSVPSPSARQAGERHSYLFMQHWLEQGHEIFFAGFIQHSEETSLLVNQGIHIAWARPVSWVRKLFNIVTQAWYPVFLSVRYQSDLVRALYKLIPSIDPDVVFLDFTQMARYAEVVRLARPEVPIVLHEHDVCIRVAARASMCRDLRWTWRRFWDWERRRLQVDEARLCSLCDLVIVKTVEDREELVRCGVDPSKVLMITPFCLPNLASENKPTFKTPAIFYFGAMDRKENVHAARLLVKRIWPRIRAAIPGITLYIIGGNPPPVLNSAATQGSGIVVTGFLENPYDLMLRCGVGVFPLRLGGGIKVKVVETMSLGIPVVTTREGFDGIPGEPGKHLAVCDSEDEMVDWTVTLLQDRQLASRMGMDARQLVREVFDLEFQLARLDQAVFSFGPLEGR